VELPFFPGEVCRQAGLCQNHLRERVGLGFGAVTWSRCDLSLGNDPVKSTLLRLMHQPLYNNPCQNHLRKRVALQLTATRLRRWF
jgi:hypothetical protein